MALANAQKCREILANCFVDELKHCPVEVSTKGKRHKRQAKSLRSESANVTDEFKCFFDIENTVKTASSLVLNASIATEFVRIINRGPKKVPPFPPSHKPGAVS